MSTTCKYCNEPEDKQVRPGLICESCICFVHLSCLKHQGTPGDFACDVFFEFTCQDCNPDKKEAFVRYKFPWVHVIYLTLNHLCTQSYGISHHGYFHYKTHICSFIDRYWQALFGASNKQKKNWVGTIAGVLSVYNKLLFKSGSVTLGETGWWRLLHNFSPAVAAHIVQEIARDKPKSRPRNQLALDRNHFLAKIAEMGYKDLINLDNEKAASESEPVPSKKRRVDSEDSAASCCDQVDSDGGRNELVEETTYEDSLQLMSTDMSYADLGHELAEMKTFEFVGTDALMPVQSDTSSIHSFQHSMFNYDSDSRSGSEQEKKFNSDAKPKKTPEDKPVFRRESFFSTELNSVDLPWEENSPEKDVSKEKETKDKDASKEKEKDASKEKENETPKEELVEMTHYAEVQFLKQIEGLIPKVKDPNKKAYLYRLKAKLALRRLKRHKHLPIFDLDKTVKLLGGYVTEEQGVVINTERVLDRFQRSYLLATLCGTVAAPALGPLLVRGEPGAARSHAGAPLKPYIRRDARARPPWLALTDELMRRTHRHIPNYQPPPRGTIDYSYVRPQHIAAVNNLCAQFFWPGIDLTEALQYPEYSVVATYRRLVVGFAFLVPDAAHNQAYISFVLARPEWRRASIATFMLYHLLQTCTGKDVTLHVSPTNPAIFLYQKFGFKVEELVQDFYEKYFDIDYKGCRHALFLRLAR